MRGHEYENEIMQLTPEHYLHGKGLIRRNKKKSFEFISKYELIEKPLGI